MQVEPDFVGELEGISAETLDGVPHVILGLRPDLTVGMVNDQWFASRGDGEVPFPTGSIVDPLPGAMKVYYTKLYEKVLEERIVVEHLYLCHTPELWRRFQMRCEPLRTGLLVTHTLESSRPHALKTRPPSTEYEGRGGLVSMCVHCSHVEPPQAPESPWHWIPEWVRRPPENVTHGMCAPCLEGYYADM